MNSNLFHNIANVLIALLGVLTAVLVAVGCVDLGTTIDCSGAFVDPKITAVATAILSALKLVVNFFRDGLGGMSKPQPPVDQ